MPSIKNELWGNAPWAQAIPLTKLLSMKPALSQALAWDRFHKKLAQFHQPNINLNFSIVHLDTLMCSLQNTYWHWTHITDPSCCKWTLYPPVLKITWLAIAWKVVKFFKNKFRKILFTFLFPFMVYKSDLNKFDIS